MERFHNTALQSCETATFLGGSGSRSLRSRLRPRLVGAGSRHKSSVVDPDSGIVPGSGLICSRSGSSKNEISDKFVAGSGINHCRSSSQLQEAPAETQHLLTALLTVPVPVIVMRRQRAV